MENIEDYIKKNTSLFEEEPKEGHIERFKQRLQQRSVGRRHRMLRSTMRVASVAVLLIMSSLYINDHFFNREENTPYVNQEFMEAQFYYTSQINEGISSIRSIDGGLTETQREQLVDEMTEADAYFEELQEDLKAMPDDPRVIKAMLNHYKTKAMIINNIVESLEKVDAIKEEYSSTVEM